LAYFDFNYVTTPPNDETVDEVTQLNNNWEEVETKLLPFNQQPADFTGITIPKGTMAMRPDDGSDRMAVWNGIEWSGSVNPANVWEAWQPVSLRAPVIARTGYTLEAKIDTLSRRIVLMGGVQLNATADAWNTATTYEITTDTAIQSSLAPANVDGVSIQQGATGAVTTASGFASAVIWIQRRTVPDRTAISVRYQGDAGGGNFIMLDGIEWWY
jgi:hypothetical protein